MSKKKSRPIPAIDHPITETHCHLDFLTSDQRSDVLDSAREAGVHRFVTIATAPGNLQDTIDIAQAYDNVWCTQGIHPHDAKSATEEVLAQVVRNCSTYRNKVVAVGEIGLDYHYEHSDRDTQKKIFEAQLRISVEQDLPVVIHSREADEDTLTILKQFSGRIRGVIHSYTSGVDLAEYALNTGLYLGFNGILTFNRADNVREIFNMTPLNRILVETDTPYLTPVPYRGKPNEPKYLPFIVERMAEEKTVSVIAMAEQLELNARQVFNLI